MSRNPFPSIEVPEPHCHVTPPPSRPPDGPPHKSHKRKQLKDHRTVNNQVVDES